MGRTKKAEEKNAVFKAKTHQTKKPGKDKEQNGKVEFWKLKPAKDHPWARLSNFFLSPLTFDGNTYTCSESAYQRAKFVYEGAPEINSEFVKELGKIPTAGALKHAASLKETGRFPWHKKISDQFARFRGLVKINPDWDNIKVDKMREIVQARFDQQPEFRRLLLSTGELAIEETSPKDSFWGTGKDGQGQNQLGKILMEVRDKNQ
jgi:ribA/ribD-fused uncharacterized protein